MSRSRHFVRGLGSSYLSLVLNAFYTLGSVPVALHYLGNDEFAIWAVVVQVSTYLMLVDLGTTSSGIRLLMDHKDTPRDGQYGSLIKTATLTQGVQALLIWLAGYFTLPFILSVLKTPDAFHHEFRVLWIWQISLLSATFAGRISLQLLTAHHRMDLVNHAQSLSLVVGFASMWLAFQKGYGLYSFPIGQTCGLAVNLGVTFGAAIRLRLFPPHGAWGRISSKTAWRFFRFGGDLFLLSLGLALIGSSQTAIISRQLGLEVTAVWAIATKLFVLAQLFVGRILDNSSSSLGEMIVRGERDRLEMRFRDIYVVTASVAFWAAATAVACNAPLLLVWTNGRVSWSAWEDALMGAIIASNAITRVHIGLAGLTKHLRGLQFIYFIEGAAFVALALWAAKQFGIPGVILCALITNLLGSGVFGSRRSAAEFSKHASVVGLGWLAPSLRAGGMLVVLAAVTAWLTSPLSPWPRLLFNGIIMAAGGGLLVWSFGLTAQLRTEGRSFITRLMGRTLGRTQA